jgi:diguanylate cyclase (GGDEF)-like protein
MAGRYGGEEFMVVLPATDLVGGAAQAERIRQAIGAEKVEAAGVPVEVTCSVGVSGWHGAGACDGLALIHRADDALYEAKRLGRNCVRANGAGAALDPTLTRLGAEIQSLG